jgi:hypothetical protein
VRRPPAWALLRCAVTRSERCAGEVVMKLLRFGLLWVFLLMIASSASSLGCIEDCAAYGEYCTDLDCCDDMTCEYDDTAGYRCR